MNNLNIATKRWIWNTWEQYTPEWFVTILWNDYPTSPITSASHTRHLRNKLLCEICGVSRCGDLPDFPNRLGITAFQERTESQNGKVTFHTHLHLYDHEQRVGKDCQPSASRFSSEDHLHYIIRYKVGSKVQKLLKSTTNGNDGVVVKRWVEDHHRYYNLKEMERQKKKTLTRYTQDGDLLLDIENSDLLPMTVQSNGYQRLSKRQNRSLQPASRIEAIMGQ